MGLCLELCRNSIGLSDEFEHILYPGAYHRFFKEDCTDDPPHLQMLCHCLPSRNGSKFLLSREEACFYEVRERSFPQDCVPVLRQQG